MKAELTYGDKCIIARNENEIRQLQAIKDLIKQNREILGRE